MKTLGQLAELVGAGVESGTLVGDPNLSIESAGTLKSAQANEITFMLSARYTDKLAESKAGAVVLPKGFVPPKDIPHLHVDNVKESFLIIAAAINPPVNRPRIGTHAKAFVSASAKIGENVSIYPGAFVGDEAEIGDGSTILPNVCILEKCKIGKNVTIYPNAVLYEKTVVGDHCIVHAGATLGGFGFGYDNSPAGHTLLSQFGRVELGDQVEIGCNTTIDRGSYGATRIGDGTKIDNQVQIGHNCQIGNHNLFCAHVGLAGSCDTGSFVVMAGQVGIGDHLTIGDGVTIGAQSGVMQDIEAGKTMMGSPAMPMRKTMQVYAVSARLPEIRSSIKSLNRKLDAMEQEMEQKLGRQMDAEPSDSDSIVSKQEAA